MEKTDSTIGVIFDLDGVLIDSHDQHEGAWFRLAAQRGLPLTAEQFKRSFGMRNENCIPEIFGWTGADDAEGIRELGDAKEVCYRELLRENGLAPLPGVRELLEDLEGQGIPRCVGSSTSRKNIELCLSLTDLAPFFGEMVTGAEDVSRGKPAPDVFLRAADKIGRAPGCCVVIEDAHVGVEAARAGGMKSVAVTTTHPAESFGDGPDRIVASLEEVDGGVLASLVDGGARPGERKS